MFFRLKMDVPSLSFDQLPAEVQAQTRSSDACSTRILRSNETLKDVSLLLTWNAYPTVADTKASLVDVGLLLKRYFDGSSLGGILDGVSEHIDQNLLKAKRIHHCP